MTIADESPPQVLVVGSDEVTLRFLTILLTRAGLIVEAAASDRAAAMVTSTTAPVVLVDRDLEAVRSIRALADHRRAATPIVVLGPDHASDGDASAARAAGATHFVKRPVTEPTLVAGLRSIVGG